MSAQRVAPLIVLVGSLLGCQQSTTPTRSPCVPTPVFNAEIRGIDSRHGALSWWIDRLPEGEANRVLMDPVAIDALNTKNARGRTGFQDVLGPAVATGARIDIELKERKQWLEKRLKSGRLTEVSKGSFERAWRRVLASTRVDDVRVVHTETTLRCIPMEHGLFSRPIDTDFDRNRCSGLHPGALLRVLRTSPDGWIYGNVGHSVGWVRTEHVTSAIPPDTARSFRDGGTRLVVLADRLQVANGPVLRLGTSVPITETTSAGWRVSVPTAEGLVARLIPSDAAVRVGFLPLTRANVWRLALSQLGHPYGWGGLRGERDCSRLMMDVMAAFGVRLSRHSGFQAKSGETVVDVSKLDEAGKLAAIRRAASRGIVLIYMKGHIMLLLGVEGNRPYAISSLSEYLKPCDSDDANDRQHQVVRVDRVAVSDLELGRGTERTAFLERMSRLAVFGR